MKSLQKLNQGLCETSNKYENDSIQFLEEKQDVEITQSWLCPSNNNYPENIAK